MRIPVVHQRDAAGIHALSVALRVSDAAAPALGVQDLDLVRERPKRHNS